MSPSCHGTPGSWISVYSPHCQASAKLDIRSRHTCQLHTTKNFCTISQISSPICVSSSADLNDRPRPTLHCKKQQHSISLWHYRSQLVFYCSPCLHNTLWITHRRFSNHATLEHDCEYRSNGTLLLASATLSCDDRAGCVSKASSQSYRC